MYNIYIYTVYIYMYVYNIRHITYSYSPYKWGHFHLCIYRQSGMTVMTVTWQSVSWLHVQDGYVHHVYLAATVSWPMADGDFTGQSRWADGGFIFLLVLSREWGNDPLANYE